MLDNMDPEPVSWIEIVLTVVAIASILIGIINV